MGVIVWVEYLGLVLGGLCGVETVGDWYPFPR